MREFVAMTQDANGGTQAVTVIAYTEEEARKKLMKMGYYQVLWII